MFKKIYLEVTNNCNLNCSFCIKNNRVKKFISLDEYLIILNKIKGYTKYLYFHVSGEPLLHPNINELINLGSKNFYINITTNGYLINRIKNNHNIRQINVSLHSFSSNYGINLDDYMNDICDAIDSLSSKTYFSLRFWVNNEHNEEIIDYLNKRYNIDIELKDGYTVIPNVFISIEQEFIWPRIDNEYNNDIGTCYALKDHIGILVGGEVVPCCLDANAVINLGNIFDMELSDIINSERYKSMLKGFQNNRKCELLCKKCNFLDIKRG